MPDIGLSKGHKPADTLREYAALCRKAVEAANRYRHAINENELEDTQELEHEFIDLYNAIWKHPEDDATLVYMDRE